MDFEIRHAMPGRIRLHVPLLAYPSMVAEATLSWLKARPWVTSARINYDCACLIVEYAAAEKAQLDGVLALLRQASVQDLEAFLGQPDTSAVTRKPAPRPTSSRSACRLCRSGSPSFPIRSPLRSTCR